MSVPIVDPFVNGHFYSRTSTNLVVAGLNVGHGWETCDWSSKLTPGIVHGSGAKPIGRTRGKLELKLSIGFYLEIWASLVLPQIAALNPARGYGENEFPIELTFFEDTSFATPFTMIAMGARVMEAAATIGQNDDAVLRKIDFSVMDISENGISIVNDAALPAA